MVDLLVSNFVQSPVLSGATLGRTIAFAFAEALDNEAKSTPIILDFEGIEVATASFLRESVLGFRQLIWQDFHAVMVKNMSNSVLDDLREVLLARREVIAVIPHESDTTDRPYVLGDLDPKLLIVLDALSDMNGGTADTLSKRFPDENIKTVTAWNNRLAALAECGLVTIQRSGRTKVYFPIWETCKYGN